MFGCVSITTNLNGVPYLRTTSTNVGTDAVDFSLGFRSVPAIGYMTIKISDAIPEGTTGTLPIQFTMNGSTRTLTYFGGASVTAADLASTGVILVWYNWYDSTLQLVAPTA